MTCHSCISRQLSRALSPYEYDYSVLAVDIDRPQQAQTAVHGLDFHQSSFASAPIHTSLLFAFQISTATHSGLFHNNMGKRKIESSAEASVKRKKHASKPPVNDVTRASSSHPTSHALVPHSNVLESAPDLSSSQPDPNFLDVMIDLALEVLTCSGPSDPRHTMAMGRLNEYAKPVYGVPTLMERFRSKGASTKAVEDVSGMMHMFQTAHDAAQKAKGPKQLEYLVKRIVKEVEDSLGRMYNHGIHSAIHRAFYPSNNNRTRQREEDDNTPGPELKLELEEPDLNSIPPFQDCESQSTQSRNTTTPPQADDEKKETCGGAGGGSSSKGGKSNANSGVDGDQDHESSDECVEDSGQESGKGGRAGIEDSSSESDEDSDSESGEDGGETSHGDVNGAGDSESDIDSDSESGGDSDEENGKTSDEDANGASSSDSDTDSDTESGEEPTQAPKPATSSSIAASASKVRRPSYRCSLDEIQD